MRLPALDRDRQKLLDAFSSEGDPTVDQLFGALVLLILMIKDRVTRERFSMFSAQVTNLPLEHDPFPAALRIMPAAGGPQGPPLVGPDRSVRRPRDPGRPARAQ